MKHTSPPTPSLTGAMPVPTRHDDPSVPPGEAIADPDAAAGDYTTHDSEDECCALVRRAPGRRAPPER